MKAVCVSLCGFGKWLERERAGGTRRKAAVLMGRAIVDLWRGGGREKKRSRWIFFFGVFNRRIV